MAVNSRYFIWLLLLFPVDSLAQNFTITKTRVVCHQAEVDDTLLVFSNIENASRPILGRTTKEGLDIAFEPLIPLQADKEYFAVCGEKDTVFQIKLSKQYQLAKVKSIFPSLDSLPSNLLKFYVQFDHPMAQNAYPYIDLVDESGKRIERAILKEIPELWSDSNTLLCVWIEPGRIKRGLGPNVKLGPVMTPESEYTIVISDKIRDRAGIEIGQTVRKTFETLENDRIKPDVNNWQVSVSNDKKNVTIDFDETLDFGSSIDAFQIRGADGKWLLSPFQNSIQFLSATPLVSGKYAIEVDPKIEDLAGNNLIRLFDQDISKEEEYSQERFQLNFEVKD